MITLYLPAMNSAYNDLKIRLDALPLRYHIIDTDTAAEPRLVDKEHDILGRSSIEAYLGELEEFAKAWYEDRCDKYDFDPDASRIHGKQDRQ